MITSNIVISKQPIFAIAQDKSIFGENFREVVKWLFPYEFKKLFWESSTGGCLLFQDLCSTNKITMEKLSFKYKKPAQKSLGEFSVGEGQNFRGYFLVH